MKIKKLVIQRCLAKTIDLSVAKREFMSESWFIIGERVVGQLEGELTV